MNCASHCYEDTEIYELEDTVLINFKNRIKQIQKYNNEYQNGNRGDNAEIQTTKIKNILKTFNRL